MPTDNLQTILENIKHHPKVRMTYKGKRMSQVFFMTNPDVAALYPPMKLLRERVFNPAWELSLIEQRPIYIDITEHGVWVEGIKIDPAQ
jgi:hypothetical protein